ncbi:Uncharacterised protein [uncultured archaeon]|nr:Uncharacterised protein [uncultured archaeon]
MQDKLKKELKFPGKMQDRLRNELKKGEIEIKPFYLLPPRLNSFEDATDYINIILNGIGEEGGKDIVLITFLTGDRDFKKCPKGKYLVKVFDEFYDSFEGLKKKLKEGELEKLASLLHMQQPNERGFGLITYTRLGGIGGEFANYKLLKRWGS